MQPGATPGAVLELFAGKANGGTGPGLNDPLTTTFYDTSGNGNHGTLQTFAGTAASGWATGPDRLVFDGSDYVSLPDLGTAEDKTFTYEAYMTSLVGSATSYALMEGLDSGGGNPHVGLRFNSGKAYLRFAVDAGTFGMAGGSVDVSSGSHHIIGTCDGTTLRLYVDGTLDPITASVPAGATTIAKCTVGAYGYGASTYTYLFNGAIALARIYPFALTPEQVAANYAAGLEWVEPVKRRPSGLLVYQSGRSTLSWQ